MVLPIPSRRQIRSVLALAAALPLAAGLILVAVAPAAAAPARVLGYVADNAGGTVSVLDTASNTVTGTITGPGGGSPYDVAVAFDGTRGYVTNSTKDLSVFG